MQIQAQVGLAPVVQSPGEQLQKRLAKLATRLDRQKAHAHVATQLRNLSDAIGDATLAEDWLAAGVERVIRPESLAASLNQKAIPGRLLRGMEWLRNVLVVVPLALTWFGISQAAMQYDSLLAGDNAHVYTNQPFLYLWQQGFNGKLAGMFILSNLALLDVALLAVVIVLTIIVAGRYHMIQQHAEKRAEESIEELTDLLGETTFYLVARQRQIRQQLPPPDLEAIVKLLFEVTQEFKRVSEEFLREMANERQQRGDFSAFLQSLKDISHEMQVAANAIRQSNGELVTLVQSIADPLKEIPQIVSLATQAVNMLQSVAGSLSQLVSDQRQWQQTLLTRLQDGLEVLRISQGQQAQQLQTMLQGLLGQIVKEQQEFAAALQVQLDTAFQSLLAEQSRLSDSLIDAVDTLEDTARSMGVTSRELLEATRIHSGLLTNQQDQSRSQQELVDKLQGMVGEIRLILAEVRQAGPELHSLAVDLEKFIGTLRSFPDLLKRELLAPLTSYSNAALNVEQGSGKITEAADRLLEAASRANDVARRFDGNGRLGQP